MADPNTRQGKRTPVTLKIKFKSETLEQFIERYAVDVSQGGIFIRTKDPLAVGTQMKFEFQLRDASPLIGGEGTVVWTRENDPSRPAIAPGMGVRFDRLADGSQTVLDRILAEKAKQAPQRSSADTGKPAFTDTPTRVAPLPVQDALLGTSSGRARSDSEQTPLPKPMPFHSDADEFGAEAFEEATKVRALDELVAATAGDSHSGAAAAAAAATAAGSMPTLPQMQQPVSPMGLASQLAPASPMQPMRPMHHEERDSAPPLPSAPEASGRTNRPSGKLLDTSPSPRSQAASTPPYAQQPSAPQFQAHSHADEGTRTKLGVEPARLPGRPEHRPLGAPGTSPAFVSGGAATPVPAPSEPRPQRPSIAPIVIGVLVIVAAVIAAVWYFVLRGPAAEIANNNNKGSDTGSAVVNNGSAGSAVAMTNSGSAGSAAANGSAVAPSVPMVDVEITANVTGATVTVADTGATGPVPFKTKLARDKAYKVTVTAAGYVAAQIDVKGGQDTAAAKLVAKPHVVSVTSDPPGAQIFVDNASAGHATPFDVELSAAQAARPKLKIGLRKGGFRPVDQIVDASGFAEDDQKMTAHVDAKLAVAPIIRVDPNLQQTSHTGSAGSAAAGSAGSADTGPTTSPDSGSGGSAPSTGPSTVPPPPSPPTAPPASTGSAAAPSPAPTTTPAASGSPSAPSASAEPEPDWSNRH